jgi:hypothetical protein
MTRHERERVEAALRGRITIDEYQVVILQLEAAYQAASFLARRAPDFLEECVASLARYSPTRSAALPPPSVLAALDGLIEALRAEREETPPARATLTLVVGA